MKTPWKKVEDKVAIAIVNLKAMYDSRIQKAGDEVYERTMKSFNLFKKSEQIKHNRLEQRIAAIEYCFDNQLKEYHRSNVQREIQAAEEAEQA